VLFAFNGKLPFPIRNDQGLKSEQFGQVTAKPDERGSGQPPAFGSRLFRKSRLQVIQRNPAVPTIKIIPRHPHPPEKRPGQLDREQAG
jgi:hypothetical protein